MTRLRRRGLNSLRCVASILYCLSELAGICLTGLNGHMTLGNIDLNFSLRINKPECLGDGAGAMSTSHVCHFEFNHLQSPIRSFVMTSHCELSHNGKVKHLFSTVALQQFLAPNLRGDSAGQRSRTDRTGEPAERQPRGDRGA